MGSIGKGFSLLLVVILAVSSLMMVENAGAQSIPKPSVPEFTVEAVDHSYVVPTSTSIDPYSGQQITHPSYKVENKTIDIRIKNQPFSSTNIDGNVTGLFYIIGWKGHYENWAEFYDGNDYFNTNHYDTNKYWGIEASNSAYTVYSFSIFNSLPVGSEIDFQVKAVIGFNFLYFGGHIQPIGTVFHYVQESDWSKTQTITTPETSASTSPNPTPSSTNTLESPTPTVPEFPSWTTLLLLTTMVVAAGLLVYHKKQKQGKLDGYA